MTSPTDWITTSVADGVAEVVFRRPPVNQFDVPFVARLEQAVDGLPGDVRAVVVRSEIPGIFAAGGDIPWMTGAPIDEQIRFAHLCQRSYAALERIACPSIAAIDGACLGGGLELALCCDIRVVGRSAVLGLPEATIGLIASSGGIHRIVRAIGQGVARDLLLTGRRVRGEEAIAIGLASRLVEDGDAADAARRIARGIADGPTEAIQATKRLAVEALEHDLDEGLARERAAWGPVRRSASSQAALEAFGRRRR